MARNADTQIVTTSKKKSAAIQRKLEQIKDVREDYDYAAGINAPYKTMFTSCYNIFRSGSTAGAGPDTIFSAARTKTPIVNLLFSAVEQAAAMLAFANPDIRAVAYEKAQVRSAKIVSDAMRIAGYDMHMPIKRQELTRSGLIYGTSFLAAGWKNKTRWNADGQIDCKVLDPNFVEPDPDTTDFEQWRYCHIVEMLPLQTVQYMTPDVEIEGADDPVQKNRLVKVVKSWYPVNSGDHKHPKGRCVIWSEEGGTVEQALNEERANPYDHGLIPIIPFYNTKVPESPWGISEMENTYSIQVGFNRNLGYISNFLKYALPKYWTNDPSWKGKDISMNPEKVMTVDGEKMMFGAVQHAMLDPRFVEIVQIFQSLMQNTTGIHSVNMGEAGGVTAASAIQGLAALGAQRMDSRKQNMKDTMAEFGQMTKALMAQYYKEQRWIHLTDEDEEGEELTNDDLQMKFRMMVTIEEVFPRDPVTKVQLLMQLLQLPPGAQERFVKYAGDAELRADWEALTKTLNQTSQVLGSNGQIPPGESPPTI